MKKQINKMFINIFSNIFTWCFLIYFGWIFLNCVFNNLNDLIHYNMKKIVPVGILLFLILILLIFCVDKFLLKKQIFHKNRKMVLFMTFFIIFIGQIIIARNTYYSCGWDAGVIVRCGKALVNDVGDFDVNYFLTFPNNILLVWIYKNIYILSTIFSGITYEFLLVVINIILVDISVFISLLVAKKISNNNITLVVSYALSILILLYSPWIIVPYSDSFSMMFPILNIYLYLRIKECDNIYHKVMLAVMIGIASMIGYQIKPTVIISVIAIFITGFIYSLKDKKIIKLSLLLGVFIILAGGATKLIYNHTIYKMEVNGVRLNSDINKQMPMTHFLMMGLNEHYIDGRGTLYGAYSEDDYNITFSCKSKEERVKVNLEEYKKRVMNLGIIGYAEYLSNKGNWMLSDGNFYYGGEGAFAISEPYADSTIAKFLQSYYLFNGENYNKNASCRQAVWIVILFLIAIPILFREKDTENEGLFLARLCIVGITIFLLLFEGRSRYFLNHLPIFIVLASYGLSRIYSIFIRS